VVTTTSGVLTAVSAATARTTLSVQPTASPAFTGAATFANTGDVVPLTVTNAGTANSFVVNDASGDTTPFVIDAAGNVGIQSTSASYSLQIQRDAAGIPADSYVAVWGNVSGSNGTTGGVRFFNRQGNADATPSKQIAGVYAGRHGDNFGGSLTFLTANASTGTQTLATRLTIDSTGTATFAGQIVGQAGAAFTGTTTVENLTLSGSARRIVADFSSSPQSNRAMFQTSASNASTVVAGIPSGTGTTCVFRAWSASDVTNANNLSMGVFSGTDASIRAESNGTASAIPLTFYTSNTKQLEISSTGTATFAGQILADDIDTANSVAYGFDSDPDTGIGRGGANVLTLVTGGVEAVTVNSGQMLLCRKGFALQGEARPSSGAGLEVNYVSASNAATIGAYDRTNNVYKELHLFGSVIDFQIGAGSDMQLNASGELLIGTTSDNGNYKLQVNSQIYATNATIATSDARFKTNFESLTDATSVIESLRPVAFDFIPQTDRNFATERQVGLIAQEAQAALAGTDYADSVVAQCGDHLGLAYEKLVPVLIKALQESNARIAALEERING
jgi:hypothetical protein